MRKGFTLIELIVVIALISILAVTLAPKVLTQINKSKVSRVLQELSDLRRDFRIVEVETNENIESSDELNSLLQFKYTTLEATGIPENNLLYSDRSDEGGWLYYEDELYVNLPNGAYTGNPTYEIWNLEGYDPIEVDNIDPGNMGTIETGDGNDTIVVNEDVERGVTLNTGKGNDSITIGDSFRARSSINTGEGDDTVDIGFLRGSSALKTGEGNDSVTVGNVGQGWNGGGVDLGSGDDTLTISDPDTQGDRNENFKDTKGTFDGGSGNNTLILKGITEEQWDNNENNMQGRFKNFETIIFE